MRHAFKADSGLILLEKLSVTFLNALCSLTKNTLDKLKVEL